jgi:UMF1 family MFS transporter
VSWALFEFARQPYVSLIFVYVFAPYYANTVVGDPVRGQEAWAFANTVQGLVVAFLAPFLGAMADRMGRRKPWIILSVVVMAPACFLLWWAMPGGAGWLGPGLIIALVVIMGACFDLGAIFHNSMLGSIVPPKDVGRLSGWGLGIGAIGTLLALIVMLFGVALPASQAVHWDWLPDRPLFGIDPASHQHERIVGPVAGVWMVVFILPLLLWTPDRPSTRVSSLAAVREGLAQVLLTVRRARQARNVGLFLASRMIYNDGLVAVIAYSGIYAVGVFHWDLAATLMFGFVLSVFCVAGGFIGGWLDERFGSRRAILIGGAITCVSMVFAVSSTPQQLLFFIPYEAARHPPLLPLPYFASAAELIFLAAYMSMACFGTAVIANSRAMLARIAPLSSMAQFFGLFALSGTATAFLGHFMVNQFTALSHSQRIGFSSTLILMLAGFSLLLLVREERMPELA